MKVNRFSKFALPLGLLIASAFIFLPILVQAQMTIIIDFDSGNLTGSVYTEDGIQVNPVRLLSDCNGDGNVELVNSTSGDRRTLFDFGGTPFTVVSVDVDQNSGTSHFTSSDFVLEEVTGLGTHVFPSIGWTDITSFSWFVATESTVCIDDLVVRLGPSEVQVDIDVKPGSDPNCFNNDGNGIIPVAILSTADFDATQVDPETVTLEGLALKAVGKSNKLLAHIEDVNGDGFLDLVVQIQDTDGAFASGEGTATLTGNLFDGTPIEGSDSICVVP